MKRLFVSVAFTARRGRGRSYHGTRTAILAAPADRLVQTADILSGLVRTSIGWLSPASGQQHGSIGGTGIKSEYDPGL